MEGSIPLVISAFISATALYIATVAGVEGDRRNIATRAFIGVMIGVAGFELGEVTRVLIPDIILPQDRLSGWWVGMISTGWYVMAAFHVRATLSAHVWRWVVRLAWVLGTIGTVLAATLSVSPDLAPLSLALQPGRPLSLTQGVVLTLHVVQLITALVGALILYLHAARIVQGKSVAHRAIRAGVVRWFIPATVCLVLATLVAATSVVASSQSTPDQPVRHMLMSWPVLGVSLVSIGLLLGAVTSNRRLLGQPIYGRNLLVRWALLGALFLALMLITWIDADSPRRRLLLATIGAPLLLVLSDWREYRRYHDAMRLYKGFIEGLIREQSAITPQQFDEQAQRVFDGLVTTLAPAAAYLTVTLDHQDAPLVLPHAWEGPPPDPQDAHLYDIRPITIGDQRIGVLALVGPMGRAYNWRELDLAESYAHSIAHLYLARRQARAIEQLIVQRTRDREALIQRIGRILHDKVVANLDAIEKNAQVLSIESKMHGNGLGKELVDDIRVAARESMALLRRLVYDELLDPYPARIDHEGLVGALQLDLIPQVQAQHQPIVVIALATADIRDVELNTRLDGTVRRTLFAAVEEAVRNAIKHGSKYGRPLHIVIQLGWAQTWFTIDVIDDGVGFHPELAELTSHGMGLRYHKAALRFIGGSLTVQSKPGQSTTIHIQVPAQMPQPVDDNASTRTPALAHQS